jgi:hypothetical protein
MTFKKESYYTVVANAKELHFGRLPHEVSVPATTVLGKPWLIR